MAGVLLDTHALYWLTTAADTLAERAIFSIAESQFARMLYVCPITAWELAIASQKPLHRDPPNLGSLSASKWFSMAVSASGAKVISIGPRIACEAAAVAAETGHKDPADCYIIATARVKKIPIITRDAVMQELAARGYLEVIAC